MDGSMTVSFKLLPHSYLTKIHQCARNEIRTILNNAYSYAGVSVRRARVYSYINHMSQAPQVVSTLRW
ncbi:unnamed protein product [Arctia plantaginis]|uniref:Uncharacterized protein n=1 Tax=Arctia plantaginis TaxID=874455 RepID=A0A8S0YZN5_ARCPL|nr:unnamed protein product [Arctia plantaginis]